MIKTASIARKQSSWSEESHLRDMRLIDAWIQQNPEARIITILSSNVKHMVIVYESDQPQAQEGRISAI